MLFTESNRLSVKSSSRDRSRRHPAKMRCLTGVNRFHIEGLEERRLLSGLLGTAESFAVLGGSAVTNTGPTIISGNLGIWPNTASSITGFPPGIVAPPAQIYAGDGVAQQAEADATTAYNTLAGLAPNLNLTGQDLGGLTLTPGVYKFNSSAQLTGTLTLDAQNDPNARFVFQIGSTLTTATNSSVHLINSPQGFANEYWQVGSSATLGTGTQFSGNILALTSITVTTGANIASGRALAINGAVTLDNSHVTAVIPGTISGIKFQDTNGDGVRQAGEPGLAGITFFLDTNGNGALDLGEQTTSTDANGNYLFTNLPPRTYSVREVVPAGWALTTANPVVVVVTSGADVPGGDFGNFQLGQINGTKFNDVNGDGLRQAGEPGLSGITLFLDTNTNGVFDAGEQTTISGVNGSYLFTGVAAGTYSVREVAPAGWTQTTINPAAVVMTSGAILPGGDFGNVQLGQINGTKFQDTNGDGLRQAGELGLSGITIFLDANSNGVFDAGERTAITDVNGGYLFANVGAGTYSVREVVPAGWTRTTINPAAIVMTSGGNLAGGDFGNFKFGHIAGTKFQDTNGDGARQVGEPIIAGITVFLDTNNNGVFDVGEQIATTDVNGHYLFTGVGPGTYRVREVVPAGWTLTTINPAAFVMSSGANLAGGDFGDFQFGQITGTKFQDTNGDGVRQAGEPILAGVTIFLDTNHNGVLDAGEPTTITDVNGNYVFTNVGPIAPSATAFNYSVNYSDTSGNISYPSTTTITTTNPLTFFTVSPGGSGTGSNTPTNIGLFSMVPNSTAPAGSGPFAVTETHFTTTFSLQTVANLDGTGPIGSPASFTVSGDITGLLGPDSDTTSISNITGLPASITAGGIIYGITLDSVRSPGVIASGGNNGGITLHITAPGAYSVREVVPPGWVQTTANPVPVVVTSGSIVPGGNFGNFQLGQISGTKFLDTNGDGVRQAGEPGLAGITLFLDANANGVFDAGERTTITDANGNYLFTGVGSGTYSVREIVPSGWTQTTINPAAVIMTSGGTLAGGTFGNFQLGQVNGTKFIDTNGNGIRQAGEPGLAGIVLFLDANANGVSDGSEQTTTTDANGNYLFTGVNPGTYSVREMIPSGWTMTTINPAAIVVTSGSNLFGGTFGNFQLGQIYGAKFQDINGDGVRQAGELGLAGITIFLDTNANGVFDAGERTTITNATGNYLFTNIGPGTYNVREVVPSGWTQSTANPAAVVMTSGAILPGDNFGNFQLGQINGTKFQDTNGDGSQQAGEPGLAGVTLFLDTNGNGVLDAGEQTATTDINGNYVFTNIGAGTYNVREVVPAGWTLTTANPAAVVITSGANLPGGTFGDFQLGQINGTKFQDTNGDGVRQAGELGLAGITLFLDTNSNGVLDAGEPTTITDASGNYLFTNLGAGTYSVREVVPTGWTMTTINPAAVAMTSGANLSGGAFGNFQLGQINGTKFLDTNGDGVRQAGEPGLAGITIFLDSNANGVHDAGEPTNTTDANGSYVFANVGPGTYSVREVVPAGWTMTTINPAAVVMTSGANLSGGTFGNFQAGQIDGTKFQDTNGDGVRQAGELGLAGITIYIDANGNGVFDVGERNTTTDANGNYLFTNIAAGTYSIREVVPSGWTMTTVNPAAIVMTSGESLAGGNFGNFQLGQINGTKFQDTNGDGVRQAGEPGLAGITLFLDANANGVYDAGEPTTLSDANGNYLFTAVGAGAYSVREIVPTGWMQTTINPASVVMSSGANLPGGDFGNFQLGQINGTKFQDTNGDGVRQAGELGLAGITVFLDTNANGVLDAGEQSTTTDVNGDYLFTGIVAGTYSVREVAPTGWTMTTVNPASVVMTSGANLSGGAFGNFQLGQINGTKFQDTNGDGVRQAGELGLAGVTIFLDTNANGVFDAGEQSTTTDVNGGYLFTGIAAGTYSVREVAPSGWTMTTVNPASVVMTSGANLPGGDFGNFQLGQISGTKFQDTNGDGARQAGEPGLAGITLFLDTNANGVLDTGEQTTITDANGNYLFTGIASGTYSVREVVPTGWMQTTINPAAVVMTSGANLSGGAFGNFQLGQINGTKFLDTNGDGVRQAGELGLAGITIFLDTNANGVLDTGEQSTITDANGSYLFTNMVAGSYTVREVVPTGWTQTTINPAAVAMTSGANLSGGIFGNFQLGQISGTKFLDTNGDGVRQADEPGLAGITIFIDANANGVLDTGEQSTTTDVNGNYLFTGIVAGTYSVREVVPSGWTMTTINPAAVVMTSGASLLGGVFGNVQIPAGPIPGGQINGTKFQDTNGDGARQADEPGLAGITIFIDANANGVFDTGEQNTITDANGDYLFKDVAPGTYSVREVVPAGWMQTTLNPADVVMTSGAILPGGDFGNFQLGEIHGITYWDVCGNGFPGQQGVALGGFRVNLYMDLNGNGVIDSADGAPIMTMVSDANGAYAFTGLVAGQYLVQEIVPAGYVLTGPTTSSTYTASVPTRTAPTLSSTYAPSVSSGSIITANDFYNYRLTKSYASAISYSVTHKGATRTYKTLTGHVLAGDKVTMSFTVQAGHTTWVSLASYKAPSNKASAALPVIFEGKEALFRAGKHTLTVNIPKSSFQVYSASGYVLWKFGPAGSNINYTAQKRVFSVAQIK